MSKILKCRDVGVDCDFVARGATEDELFQECAKHGRQAHNMKSIPSDLRAKMRRHIREENP